MAIRKMTEGVSRWNSRRPFPKNRYAARCTSEKLEKSSSGNPMIVREWEILHSEPVNIDGELLDIDGLPVTQYRVLKVKKEGSDEWDVDKSNKSFGSLKEELKIAGFTEEEVDDENPPLLFKGKVFDIIVYGKESKEYKSQTPEQKKKGIREPIKDARGNDIVTYQLQVQSIIEPSQTSDSEGRPY